MDGSSKHGDGATQAAVLSQLRRVRALRFDARSDAATGWNGTGTGTVVVTEPADGVVVFEEAGTWQADIPGRPAIGFNNVFRWSRIDAALRLEHLRFGLERPVWLFDLVPGENGAWRERSAHLCGADRYAATLRIAGGRLEVAWSIVGPRKRESIRYAYW